MSKQRVQQQFGPNAKAYATSPVHAKGASLPRLVALLAPKASWQVLDLATAAGHTAFALAPHVAQVIATDLTTEMLTVAQQLAQEKSLTNVSFEEADAEGIPFEDHRFDLVTCRIAAHHFPNVDRFLAETARVLRPGGLLAVVDNVAPDAHIINSASDEDLQQAALYYNQFEKLRDPSHHWALTLGEWLAAYQTAGFTTLHSEFSPKRMAFQPWVERLGADEATQEKVRLMVDEAPPLVAAYLQPEFVDETRWFTIAEAIIIGQI